MDGTERPFTPPRLSQEEEGGGCKAFTRFQKRRFFTPGGGASAISGPASQLKDGMASKKHRTTWFRIRHAVVGREELGKVSMGRFWTMANL